MPLLCDKVGINNAILREKVKKLLQIVLDVYKDGDEKIEYKLYDQKKTIAFIMKYGVNNKNGKSVGECLEELANLVKEQGTDLIS